MVTAPARREAVGWMRNRGLSERKALRIESMSASALRYRPRPDRNIELRQKIVALAQRHLRCGNDLSEAPAGRRNREPQAGGGASVCCREAADQAV